MKVIYQNKIHYSQEAESDYLVLEEGTRVPYGDPTLIVDPTDGEVDFCKELEHRARLK